MTAATNHGRSAGPTGTWLIWISLMSYFVIKVIDTVNAENAAAAQVNV